MSNDPISESISKRICTHMNKDHNDAVLNYAINYGGVKDPLNVEMLEINSGKMILRVDGKKIEIPFDHTLVDSSDAHKTLVAMSKNFQK